VKSLGSARAILGVKKMRRVGVTTSMLVGSLLVCGSPADASFAQSGQITTFGVEQGKVFFITTGSRDSMPACATAGNRWVFDGSTAKGQAMMSALLTYKAMGKQVIVQGTGACADWGDTESVEYIWSVGN
jgi:hypothetical protein